MILYVNGDSHAAAAECVNPYAWAEDDALFWGLGRMPHPDNERASFGCELANWLNAILYLDAQAGGSNARIMRTTREWIDTNIDQLDDVFIVLQWSTWERKEWFHDNVWWQVNASGTDHLPTELQDQYKKFIADVDWHVESRNAHEEIWQFHQELKDKKIRHIMFNGNSHFENILERRDWGVHYIGPYDRNLTYDSLLKNNGFNPVSAQSWHFGLDAHCYWGEYLLQYIRTHNLV